MNERLCITEHAWLRKDGRKGIRNVILVAYLVECAHHVSRKIVEQSGDTEVHLIGFPGCFPNEYASKMLKAICTHPNVGGVLLISLGCESMNRDWLLKEIKASGRSADLLIIQESGGTKTSIEKGVQSVKLLREGADNSKRAPMYIDELVVGTICGGSDGTSGISANPSVGRCFDTLVLQGATCLFEETGELIGCENIMADRAISEDLGKEIVAAIEKAKNYYRILGMGSFAPGNADGGLTTLEEKSLGAYSKSGSSMISGLLKPGDIPPVGGLYLLDVVPDGEPRFGFPNISDNAEIVELIACGSHLTLFTTGRGSVVGSAISPVIKVCANPETYNKLASDMDINAGKVIAGEASLEELGQEIYARVMAVVKGEKSVSEELGHQEFILTYKSFEPIGPACLPLGAAR